MNDVNEILQALERLEAGQKALQETVNQQGGAVNALQEDISSLKDSLAHTNTAIKALPTKQDMEAAVDAARSELKADIAALRGELKSDVLLLESKIVRKVQGHERRITNIEEQEGIENPEKN